MPNISKLMDARENEVPSADSGLHENEKTSRSPDSQRRARSVASIVEAGMCVGCGLCESLAGRDQLQMSMTSDGFLRPMLAESELEEVLEHDIVSVCPGIHQQRDGDDTKADPIWGAVRGTYVGEVADQLMKFEGSSGGAITAIATSLLESGEVKSVLHVMADPEMPMRSVSCISRSREDVRRATGSRYGPVAPLTRLHEILQRDEPFAFVGKPCDVAGIRNLARVDARVNKLMKVAVSFPCGGLPSHAASVRMASRYGFGEHEVSLMRHRGHGCPGPTRIESHDGRTHEQNFDDTWFKEFGPDVQFRCKICPDSMGEQADVVCGDAWDVDGKRENVNLVIARTSVGVALLKSVSDAGVMKLKALDAGALARMQPHHLARKTAVAARLLGLALAGELIPSFRRMGLIRSAFRGRRSFLSNMFGTRARVKSGTNREALARWDKANAPQM